MEPILEPFWSHFEAHFTVHFAANFGANFGANFEAKRWSEQPVAGGRAGGLVATGSAILIVVIIVFGEE